MKITHICLCGPVTDNWSYQDNLLPKYHQKLGYDVSVITSKFIWNNNGEIELDNRDIYYNEYGIKTIRIPNKYGTTVHSKLKLYKGLYQAIEIESPDILFIHGVQFLDIKQAEKYLKRNPSVKAYVDNHADFSNSATNWVSKKILHEKLWREMAKIIEPYVEKFYGVLPARVDFLTSIYKIPETKVELLPLGADDNKVDEVWKGSFRDSIRDEYNIKSNDFLIVTGGKIDSAKKQTLLLMKAVQHFDKNIKLIVFGSVSEDLKNEVEQLTDRNKIQYIGWIDSKDSYKYFSAADLVVFPGRHSVFWEQVVGLGMPLVVKHWKGTTHVDVGGNCKFIYEDSVDDIYNTLESIIANKDVYNNMLNVAKSRGMNEFSYSKIAKKSLEIN